MRRTLYGLLASVAFLLGIALFPPNHPSPQQVMAQSLCPTGISLGSSNGVLSLDSAVAVMASGCPAGTSIAYYADIPSSSSHPCSDSTGVPQYCYHVFVQSTATAAWVDLSRNEANPTEFPDGYYTFYACASQCMQSSYFYLAKPSETDVRFNPWAPPGSLGSNMQWSRDLCDTSTSCDTGAQHMQGIELFFLANPDNNNADGATLYQNLNGYLSNPNPGDQSGGFTQLVIGMQSGVYIPEFYEFSNDVDYCLNYPIISVSNPTNYCYNSYPADGAQHWFWMQINTNPASCKDTRYQCLQVYLNGTYYAEERMQSSGDLHNPYIQNETYTSPNSSVWGAQLNYWDYSNANRPGSLNHGFRADIAYVAQQYMNVGGLWSQFFWNTPLTYDREISDPQPTWGVYCGPFSEAYYPEPGTAPNQSSAAWGNVNLHDAAC